MTWKSIGGRASSTPVRPPNRNVTRKPIANSIGVSKRDRAAPHRADPVEELDAGRHRDQEATGTRRTAAAPRRWRTCGAPTRVIDSARDRDRRADHALVAEQRLAAEHRDDLGDDAEERQRDDVDLGVAEEPEQVLPEHRAAVVPASKTCAPSMPVGQQRRAAPRSGSGRPAAPAALVTRMFQVKIGIRNIVMPGARRVSTVVIMLTPPRMVPRPEMRQADDPQVGADAGRVERVAERRVGVPAEVGRAARGEEAGHRGQRRRTGTASRRTRSAAGTPRPGAPICSGSTQVGEREHDRRREEQQHDRAVHGEQLVVLLRATGTACPGGPARRASAAPSGRRARKNTNDGDQVHHADQLGVGRAQQVEKHRPTRTSCRTGAGRLTIGEGAVTVTAGLLLVDTPPDQAVAAASIGRIVLGRPGPRPGSPLVRTLRGRPRRSAPRCGRSSDRRRPGLDPRGPGYLNR